MDSNFGKVLSFMLSRPTDDDSTVELGHRLPVGIGDKIALHEKLQRAVWLCISQDDLELATSELRVFKQMLATS